MKNSIILRQVKRQLRRNQFICCEIDGVAGVNKANPLRDWVRSLLGSSYTFESWLAKHGHPEAEEEYRDPKVAQRTFETRRAWLDWMITYWEAKGQ
jgi:hypothetical protein